MPGPLFLRPSVSPLSFFFFFFFGLFHLLQVLPTSIDRRGLILVELEESINQAVFIKKRERETTLKNLSKMPLTLYNYNPSTNCVKVRLLASILHIDLNLVEIDLFKGQQQTSEYLAINPKGKVPTLVVDLDDGKKLTLTDSAAILVYLAGKSSFWSTDVTEQALIINWLVFTATWIYDGIAAARAIILFRFPVPESRLVEVQKKGEMSLDILEKHFSGGGRRQWLELGRPTIADLALYSHVVLAPVGKVSLEPFENVRNWISRVEALPGFINLN